MKSHCQAHPTLPMKANNHYHAHLVLPMRAHSHREHLWKLMKDHCQDHPDLPMKAHNHRQAHLVLPVRAHMTAKNQTRGSQNGNDVQQRRRQKKGKGLSCHFSQRGEHFRQCWPCDNQNKIMLVEAMRRGRGEVPTKISLSLCFTPTFIILVTRMISLKLSSLLQFV